MKSAEFTLLFFALICSSGRASDKQYPLHWEKKSPDGDFRAKVFQQEEVMSPVLAIEGPGGNLIFAPAHDAPLRYRVETARWSPDSALFAIASDNTFTGETWIFARNGSVFIPVPAPTLPYDLDNAKVWPVRWISGRRLILQFSGPHAGKYLPSFYNGRFTIRVPRENPRCEPMYSHIVWTVFESEE